MKARFSLICDAANISQEGKLNVLGAFNTIQTAAVPAMHASLTYVASLEVDSMDVGRDHVLELRYVNEDGRVLAPPLRTGFRIEGRAEPGHVEAQSLLLRISPMTVPSEGKFCLDLWYGEQRIATCDFTVSLVTPPP